MFIYFFLASASFYLSLSFFISIFLSLSVRAKTNSLKWHVETEFEIIFRYADASIELVRLGIFFFFVFLYEYEKLYISTAGFALEGGWDEFSD